MHQSVEEESVKRTVILILANGETVIGNVSKETSGYVELLSPFKILSMFNQAGNMNISIMKWDMTIDFEFPVRVFKTTIVACGKPNDTIIEYYRELLENKFDGSEDIDSSEETSLENDMEQIEARLRELMKSKKDILH